MQDAGHQNKSVPWWQRMVLYQVYLRSFADSNGDGVGDLPGLISKIDYFSELGVSALWLSPLYPSPDRDFGYDVADYCAIDQRFGNLADFDRLVELARERGLRILMDGVFNHCSDQHPWFVEARSNLNSQFRDFFHWRTESEINNWVSVVERDAWTWCEQAQAYYLHSFYPSQPDLNWHNPKLRQKILEIMEFWLARGVSGFRLDVYNCYAKDPEYRNNPLKTQLRSRIRGWLWPYAAQVHKFDRDGPQLGSYLRPMWQLVHKYDAILLGETLDEQARYRQSARWVNTGCLDMAFNFELLHCKWQAAAMHRAIARNLQALNVDAVPIWAFSNHDFKRHASRWGQRHADPRMRLITMMLLTLRGVACIYQGEELGLRQGKIAKSQLQDPLGRRFWPYYKGRDGSRTPMHWDAGAFAGFSQSEPWLPLNKAYIQRNVAAQRERPDSLWRLYQDLIAFRNRHPALVSGQMWLHPLQKAKVLSWQRVYMHQEYCIVLNMSHKPVVYALDAAARGSYNVLKSTHQVIGATSYKVTDVVKLSPYEGLILQKIIADSII